MADRQGEREPQTRRVARTVCATVCVVAAGAASVFAVLAVGTRSGSGDGFGDLLPLVSMMASAPLMVIGALLVIAAAVGRARTAVAAVVVLGLGAVLTVPVLMFDRVPTTVVSLCEVLATLAALVVACVRAPRS